MQAKLSVTSLANSPILVSILLDGLSYSVLFILLLFLQIFTLFRAFLFAYGGICAAKVLHKRLLKSILSAPVSFFDVTPVCRHYVITCPLATAKNALIIIAVKTQQPLKNAFVVVIVQIFVIGIPIYQH